MFLYFLFLLIPLLAAVLGFNTINQKKVLTLTMSLFFCFGYMTGSDWIQYEEIYSYSFSKLLENEVFEPGYFLLNIVFKIFGIDFWLWYIFIKIILFYLFCFFLNKLYPEKYFLSLFFFVGVFGLYLFIDNPLRNIMAAVIFFFAYDSLQKRNLKMYFFICVISLCFHKSAAILIPLYFLVNKDYSNRVFFFCYLILNVVSIFGDEIIRLVVGAIGSIVPSLQHSVTYYLLGESKYAEGSLFSLGSLAKFFTFILVLKYKKILIQRFGLVFFNLIIVYYFIYRFAVGIEILGRFTIYFMPFYVVSSIYIIFVLNKFLRVGYVCFVFTLTFFSYYITLTSSHKYLPYSNYIEYLFDEKPSYSRRMYFNYFNSPYKKDDEN